MDAFFRPRKPCVLPCGHQTEKTLGVVWGSWTSSPGPPPLGHSTRRRGRGRRGGTGDRSCPTWTIPAVGGRQAWAGTGPPSPTCPEALSDTSLWAERQALSRPLDTGSSCLAMSLLQGAPFQEPWGLAIGQHNNHSGSCGLSAPLGQQGRTPRGLRGVCFPVRAPSRLLCPGCTTREEGPHSRSPLETTRWGGNLAF